MTEAERSERAIKRLAARVLALQDALRRVTQRERHRAVRIVETMSATPAGRTPLREVSRKLTGVLMGDAKP